MSDTKTFLLGQGPPPKRIITEAEVYSQVPQSIATEVRNALKGDKSQLQLISNGAQGYAYVQGAKLPILNTKGTGDGRGEIDDVFKSYKWIVGENGGGEGSDIPGWSLLLNVIGKYMANPTPSVLQALTKNWYATSKYAMGNALLQVLPQVLAETCKAATAEVCPAVSKLSVSDIFPPLQ